jgi:hypothetical protein
MFILLIIIILSCLCCFGIGIEVLAFDLYKQNRISYEEYVHIKSWNYAYNQIVNGFKKR